MTENYNYQYIENDPNQIYYTSPEVTTTNQYPTTTTYNYEIPKTKEVYTMPQNVKYETKLEQPIYKVKSNKVQGQTYAHEYPTQNYDANNNVIYQYDNTIQTLDKNKNKVIDANYGYQQQIPKKIHTNNKQYIQTPQTYTNTVQKQPEKNQIKKPQYQINENQIIYQNSDNIIQQYQTQPQKKIQNQPKKYQNQPPQKNQNQPQQQYIQQPQQQYIRIPKFSK